jgi:hypothetical protein
MENELTRRDLIKLAATATAVASLATTATAVATLGAAGVSGAVYAPAFFTMDELALVDELSDLILPADAHSPGARAAQVAAYIDSRLAEAWEASDKTRWRDGLKLVEQLSRDMNGRPFLQSAPEARVAVLTRMAANEAKPEKPEEQFFAELKSRVVHAYYTSEIGIKQEMEYRGNSYLAEFEGTDVSK